MGFADVWNKTLVYFGIAEEEEWDEDGYLTDEDLQRAYAERPNVRRLAPRFARVKTFRPLHEKRRILPDLCLNLWMLTYKSLQLRMRFQIFLVRQERRICSKLRVNVPVRVEK